MKLHNIEDAVEDREYLAAIQGKNRLSSAHFGDDSVASSNWRHATIKMAKQGKTAQLNLAIFLILFAIMGTFLSKASFLESKINAAFSSFDSSETAQTNPDENHFSPQQQAISLPVPDLAKKSFKSTDNTFERGVSRVRTDSNVHQQSLIYQGTNGGSLEHYGLLLDHSELFDEFGEVVRSKMVSLERLAQFVALSNRRSSESNLVYRLLILKPSSIVNQDEGVEEYFNKISDEFFRFGLTPEQILFGNRITGQQRWWIVARPIF